MELTRRDAVAALAAIGGAGGAAYGYTRLRGDEAPSEQSEPSDEHVLETMVAVATVVYPSELSGVEAFVEEFVTERLDGDHGAGIREAVAILDEHTDTWYDDTAEFVSLSPVARENALENLGADVADENPTGSTAERVRYYVVNDLLLALYSSPTGGRLVGIENPQGHPGGTESYQQGPDR